MNRQNDIQSMATVIAEQEIELRRLRSFVLRLCVYSISTNLLLIATLFLLVFKTK